MRILIFGASYGALLATKILLAGHSVKLVCLPAEADLINSEGTRIRFPVKGRKGLVEVDSRELPGTLSADIPKFTKVDDFDLVVLAMQEPQYASSGVRELLNDVARRRIPAMSIMNMPPLPYLARIPTIAVRDCRGCYTDPTVWDSFDPLAITACSPDPQAFRPPEEKLNVLQVRLATNFKAAPFASEQDNAKLVRLQADIEAVRFADMEVPVKLKVHESVFVPLAKWPMLIAGNYRCITDHGPRSIKDAVHSDLRISRTVYEGVVQLCLMLGADTKDLVPFEKYASAALTLTSPSSVARALSFNAPNVERVDRLVQTIGAEKGIGLSGIDDVVAAVDTQLRRIRTVTS